MPRAGLTAERLTLAAADLADAHGFERLTLSLLARHFGVKDASLYSHLRGLAELRARVALLATGELADRLTGEMAGRSGREALTAFADTYRTYALEHPGRHAATQAPLSPEFAAAAAESPAARRSIAAVYALMRGYRLREPDLTDAVRLLRSTFNGWVALEAAGNFRAEREVEASWQRTVQALHTLLENWPGTAAG